MKSFKAAGEVVISFRKRKQQQILLKHAGSTDLLYLQTNYCVLISLELCRLQYAKSNIKAKEVLILSIFPLLECFYN